MGTVTFRAARRGVARRHDLARRSGPAIGMIEGGGPRRRQGQGARAKGRRSSRKDEDSDDSGDDVDLSPRTSEIAGPQRSELSAPIVDITEDDDPVRMYWRRWGDPAADSRGEISLARKIELTRKQFRKELLSSGFSLRNAIEILEGRAQAGAFDPHAQVNQQDPKVSQEADLSDRLPGNITTRCA
ncbi:MAG: hypothetical protein H6835_20050 [Planctomycetes bacterium]|nr:hypothetical protein [Planctomycetota bacterium]